MERNCTFLFLFSFSFAFAFAFECDANIYYLYLYLFLCLQLYLYGDIQLDNGNVVVSQDTDIRGAFNIVFWEKLEIWSNRLVLVMTKMIEKMLRNTDIKLLATPIYATRNPTRYPDVSSQPYPNPNRSQKALPVRACPEHRRHFNTKPKLI